MAQLLTIKQASEWATAHLERPISPSNISYLVQYGRVPKISENGSTYVSVDDLTQYYQAHVHQKEAEWKEQLGDDINWALSFDHLREKDTTKHVHRLHPYKGKFIPQLVDYFLDEHVDEFKREAFFTAGDIILDPFCGSGTTLVQANELGIHAVGVDVSAFNALIANVKVGKFELLRLQGELERITTALTDFGGSQRVREFEATLLDELNQFNQVHFPSPDYRRRVRLGEIDYKVYGAEREGAFRPVYDDLRATYQIKLLQKSQESFLDKWVLQPVRDEIDLAFELVKQINNEQIRNVVALILSRTIRSCRATTHADLGTLVEPISSTYYCHKHGKICKPLFSILSWWKRYAQDTIKRLTTFDQLRTDTHQICLVGDSTQLNITEQLTQKRSPLAQTVRENGIDGIFSSPPYVGLIDYHEQHAYAYDLFGFERNDEREIGAMFRGKSKQAKALYVEGIAAVLRNCRPYLVDDYNIFLVANDKANVYPQIAELAQMQIVDRYRRPVLNRVERDRSVYSETIFHLKEA